MLRGSGASRSRIVALLPVNKSAAWRAGVGYASVDPALDLGVSSSPAAPGALSRYLSLLPRCGKHEGPDYKHRRFRRGWRLPPARRQRFLARLEASARQRSRRWLPALQERRQRRIQGDSRLHLQRAQVRNEIDAPVVAYDAAGNTSIRAEATGSTSTAACTGGSSPPPTSPPPVAGATIQPGQSWQSAYNAAAANSRLNVAAGNHGRSAPLGATRRSPSSGPTGQSSANSTSTPRTSRWTTSTSTATPRR